MATGTRKLTKKKGLSRATSPVPVAGPSSSIHELDTLVAEDNSEDAENPTTKKTTSSSSTDALSTHLPALPESSDSEQVSDSDSDSDYPIATTMSTTSLPHGLVYPAGAYPYIPEMSESKITPLLLLEYQRIVEDHAAGLRHPPADGKALLKASLIENVDTNICPALRDIINEKPDKVKKTDWETYRKCMDELDKTRHRKTENAKKANQKEILELRQELNALKSFVRGQPSSSSTVNSSRRGGRPRRSDTRDTRDARELPQHKYDHPYYATKPSQGSFVPWGASSASIFTPGQSAKADAPPRLTEEERAILTEHDGCNVCRRFKCKYRTNRQKCEAPIPSSRNYRPVSYKVLSNVSTTSSSTTAQASSSRRTNDKEERPNKRPRTVNAVEELEGSSIEFSEGDIIVAAVRDAGDTTDEGDSESSFTIARPPLKRTYSRKGKQPVTIAAASTHDDTEDEGDHRATENATEQGKDVQSSSPVSKKPPKVLTWECKVTDAITSEFPVTVHALIDSGAALVLISEKVVSRLGLQRHPLPRPMSITTATRAHTSYPLPIHAIIAPSLSYDIILAISTRITGAEEELRHQEERERVLRDFEPVFADVPHADKLPTDVLAEIKLKDANFTMATRTYSCPRKFREAWKTLIQQHLDAGRIQESSAPMASPAFIIPKADPTALPRWTEVHFLGHIINRDGIYPDNKKIERISNWPKPTSAKEVRGFLGLVRFLASFLPQLARYTQVLNRLTEKECDYDFPEWTEAHQAELEIPVCAVLEAQMISPWETVKSLRDGLSRAKTHQPVTAVMKISPEDELRKAIIQGYKEDAWCKKALETKMDYLTTEGNLLFYKGRLIIPRVGQIRETILSVAHKALGHFGFDKTYETIRESFYWPGMRTYLESAYIPSCLECQKNKSPTTKPVGPLHPLPVPDGRFSSIAMDFVGPLPEEDGFNYLLTITDRLGADVRLIPCTTDISAPQLAELFFANWYCENGLPAEIISDRDKLFLSTFWQEFMSLLDVKVKMSTAFHPQTDGSSERTNKTVNQLLRNYVTDNQEGWVRALPRVRFAIMNTVNASTGYTGFQLRMAFSPRVLPVLSDTTLTEKEQPSAMIARLGKNVMAAQDNLLGTKINQAATANKHRRDEFPFKEGEQALLSTKNRMKEVQNVSGNKIVSKLAPRYDGPYKTVAIDEPHSTVTLDVPGPDNKCKVFHTSVVRKFIVPAPEHQGLEAELTRQTSLSKAPPPIMTRTGPEYVI
ncbi:hypothetical protein NP233_g2990 [Leucocoprinus birnbaumii]|uniref:Integrase catalytic domain-containing protein n=1 Tax=Leucocoprinus birnbaumii TaxID=56174 RepID=A0AAD5YUC9_9AGAR|nr:hypothetical protein NP233_g2990 [Leucocoprinus birnbaumii]